MSLYMKLPIWAAPPYVTVQETVNLSCTTLCHWTWNCQSELHHPMSLYRRLSTWAAPPYTTVQETANLLHHPISLYRRLSIWAAPPYITVQETVNLSCVLDCIILYQRAGDSQSELHHSLSLHKRLSDLLAALCIKRQSWPRLQWVNRLHQNGECKEFDMNKLKCKRVTSIPVIFKESKVAWDNVT